jgi:hypothetical protein
MVSFKILLENNAFIYVHNNRILRFVSEKSFRNSKLFENNTDIRACNDEALRIISENNHI